MLALHRCPCGTEVELSTIGGDLPFEVRCTRPGCQIFIRASHQDFVVSIWEQQARLPHVPGEGGFELVNYPTDPKPKAPWPNDAKTRALVTALHELEAGGPGGIATWGVNGMRARARQALIDAGVFSDRARARFEREEGVTLQAVRTDV